MTRTPTIGIDLGTTNSCVATLDRDGAPRIITNVQGDVMTPSTVSFEEHGDQIRPIVGAQAKRRAATNPRDTVFGVKRLMGRRFDEVEITRLAKSLPYGLCPAPNGDAWVAVHGVGISPQATSALVLNEIRLGAEAHFKQPVRHAIITVPAYFDNSQRQATVDAAQIAGLEVRRLLNEPTAAALGYGAHQGANRRFAVCDLGGGTFDVSIVNVEDGVFEVISTHGDALLGGDDFDRTILEHLVAEVKRDDAVDLAEDAQALQRLREEAQLAKHALSDIRETRLRLPYLARTGSGALNYDRLLTRAELEAWTAPILERLVAPCREAVARCNLQPDDVDAVILVGGMTRMPAVQHTLATVFGRQPLKVVNPEEIVSIGAAIQCAILDGRIEGVILLDVTSRALGLGINGRYQQVIPRNATIPTREHKLVATAEDDQTEVAFDVYEGESSKLQENRHLGRFVCSGLPKAPAGEVLVLVEMTVDVDGILRVSTTELASGNQPTLRLVATAGLTREDVRDLRQSLSGERQ